MAVMYTAESISRPTGALAEGAGGPARPPMRERALIVVPSGPDSRHIGSRPFISLIPPPPASPT
ncbi:hypothetical protein E2C01_062172 [Portunus trituberculatus]|uniref:Uncharacterized protein n=1 Tax=Portunus trituberculatus TaxID=210409 RepID=A0A5B7HHA3_PORTR|nr:hypothetical protein [Portunus trituberculatus]